MSSEAEGGATTTPWIDEPADEADLLARARRLAGATIGEVAASVGAAPVPPDQRRAKGYVGQLVERALGATAGSAATPDFAALGVELKTIPVRADGRPRESTFVCSIPLVRIAETDWPESRLRRKLARVLWLPVESEPSLPLGARRLGTPLLWSPSRDQEDALRQDWDDLAGLIGAGRIDEVTAHLGRWLQVRPKAAHSRIRGRAPDCDGAWLSTLPRGFYLRARFTGRVLAEALSS